MMQSEDIINSLNKSLTSESDSDISTDFAERLKTYIDGQKWIRKPSALSPTICAQYGWKCIRSDLLECVTCGAKLSVYEPKSVNYEAYKACTEKTLSNLKDSHGKHCPWPLTPSPENLVKMILMPKEEALSQFLRRAETSSFFQASFPKIEESVISQLGFTDQQILSLCKMASISTEEACHIGKTIISLSATGWIVVEEPEMKRNVLKCSHCLRSVWCGSFCQLDSEDSLKKENESNEINSEKESSEAIIHEESEDNKENSDEPPAKRRKTSLVVKKGEPFNPLHEHRSWCLWIHNGIDSYSSTSHDPASEKTINVPGWKIFIKSLLRNISDSQTTEAKDSPSKEQIRNVKSLLDLWTDAV